MTALNRTTETTCFDLELIVVHFTYQNGFYSLRLFISFFTGRDTVIIKLCYCISQKWFVKIKMSQNLTVVILLLML
jgi:hypothetical protein